MTELEPTKEQINEALKSSWLNLVEGQMSPREIEEALKHLNGLSLEEQNSQLNLATTYMAEVKGRGV